jgi:hypothetical protein
MKKAHIIILIVIAVGLCSCKTAEFGHSVIDVNGMVYDFANRPVPNYTVRIGEGHSSITDINGRFLVARIPTGPYLLRGEGTGFESYEGDILVNNREQIVYLRVPSFGQLLNLIDDALFKNQLTEAEGYAYRASRTGGLTTELLFYMAVINFRQKDYMSAIENLRTAIKLGSTDIYVEKFLGDIVNKVFENEKNKK